MNPILRVYLQTHASKASLFDDGPAVHQEDTVSAIFAILRDFAAQHKTDVIDYAQVVFGVLCIFVKF
jgi:hypothetical protein